MGSLTESQFTEYGSGGSPPADHPGRLSDMVYQSNAWKIHLRFNLLGINYFVFRRNYEELRKLLVVAQSPESFHKLWIHDKKHEMAVVMRELTRLLHNFIASARTLVDHTRLMIRDWYSETQFMEEYQLEVEKRFVDNPVSGFVEDLRNYALHYRLPFTNARLEVVADTETRKQVTTQAFVLHKAELMQWSGWTGKGKTYLEADPDVIAVLDFVDQYFQQVQSFHEWMQDRLSVIHAADLRWLEDMQQRVRKALERQSDTRGRRPE